MFSKVKALSSVDAFLPLSKFILQNLKVLQEVGVGRDSFSQFERIAL
jgi:hypothetical protein